VFFRIKSWFSGLKFSRISRIKSAGDKICKEDNPADFRDNPAEK